MAQGKEEDQGKVMPPGVPQGIDGHSEDSTPPKFSKGNVLQVGTAAPISETASSADVKKPGHRDWVG